MVLRSLGILLVASVSTASAQGVMTVRVGVDQARVMSRPSPTSDVMATPVAGATLETLDKMNGWYWVLVERDSHGTQRAGWIRETDLEGYIRRVASEIATGRIGHVDVEALPAAVAVRYEKPKKRDERKLRKMEQDLENARLALERLRPAADPAAAFAPDPTAAFATEPTAEPTAEPAAEPTPQH